MMIMTNVSIESLRVVMFTVCFVVCIYAYTITSRARTHACTLRALHRHCSQISALIK